MSYLNNISVIILSAGEGTRMKSTTPKVLNKLSGRPMIFYIIDVVKIISNDINIVINNKSSILKETISQNYLNIKFHIQDIEKYPGTAGALKNISTKNQNILILNGDMPLINKDRILSLLNINFDINLSVINLENPSGYGRVDIKNKKIVKIIEEKDCNQNEKKITNVNGGVYFLKKELLNKYISLVDNKNNQNEYYLTDIIKLAVDDNKNINPVYVDEDDFKGVNTKYDLAEAEIIMQNRIKKKLMLSGIRMRLPDSIYIDSRAVIEKETILENGVVIEGDSKIINSHIKAHSVIENSIIENSSIGVMAHIRPNSKIINSHIGNFVEVKNSILNSVKAGHLSYLGDSTIDEGTNIGAGVITCNYDGKAKYKTTIGKNVFIGSDSQLIAPIKIEDNVLIAAGTTLNENLLEGELGISRTPLKKVKNFFYKFFKK